MQNRQIRIAAVGDHILAGAGDARAIGWWGRVLARTSAQDVTLENYVLAVPHETTEQLNERWWTETSRRFDDTTENRLVVALSDAWQKGAQSLDAEAREAFANDPLNLLAVDGPANQSKSDGDAATWLPPNKAYRCTYVAAQIDVKATYGLWVTQPEKDAMLRVLGQC